MKQNGVVCLAGPALLLFIFRFEYLISGPKSYRDFRETRPQVSFKLSKGMGHSRVLKNEAKCKTFRLIMCFIYMRIKTHVYFNGLVRSLAWTKRLRATRK